MLVFAWIVVFAVLVRGAVIRRSSLVVPVTSLRVAILAVLHSLIDFTLRMPGYSIVALALIGAGLAQSFAGSPDKPVPERGIPVKNHSRVRSNEIHLSADS
jgi:hypothetical protein